MNKSTKTLAFIVISLSLVISSGIWANIIRVKNEQTERGRSYIKKGVALEDQNKTGQAIDSFRTAISLDNKLWEAHYYLGGIYLKESNTEKAKEQFAEVLRLNSALPEAYNAMGIVYFKEGRVDIATAYFQASLRLNPQDEKVYALIETINGMGNSK